MEFSNDAPRLKSTTDLAIEALLEVMPEECEIVGPDVVRDIVEGEVEFVRTEGGANIDLGDIVSSLAVAAAIISNLINIYKFLRDTDKNAPLPSPALVKAQVDYEKEPFKLLSPEVTDRLCVTVCTKCGEHVLESPLTGERPEGSKLEGSR